VRAFGLNEEVLFFLQTNGLITKTGKT